MCFSSGILVTDNSFFAIIQKKQLYGAWEKVKDYSPAKAHQLYISHVNNFISKYGVRDE